MGVDPNSPPLMNGLHNARVVDIALFHRLREEIPGIGAKRIARALGINSRAAAGLLRGEHWQQDPVKVRLFNEYKHTSLDPATGLACAADMKAFGRTAKERRAVAAAMKPGGPSVAGADVETEEVERMALPAVDPPARLDTAFFQGELDVVIWRLLKEFDGPKISKMNGRELSASVASLLEKRALLRGEPTAIVRNENRGSLEKVGELLLAEMARRGMKVGGPEMVTIEGKSS